MTADVLCLGDVHMSNGLPFAKMKEDGVTDRLQDQLSLWAQVGDYAVANGIKTVWIAGDFYDKANLDPVTLNESTRAISRLVALGIRVWILPGNHDAETVAGGRFNVEALGAIPGVQVFKDPVALHELVPGWIVRPIPYASLSVTRKWLEEARNDQAEEDKPSVVLFHNSIVGFNHLSWTCDEGILLKEFKGFDYVISGHFHTHQKFPKGKGMYMGAPMQHDFGDVGENRGFWHFQFGKTKVRAKLVSYVGPSFHALEGPLEEDGFFEWAAEEVAPGDYIRVTTKCTTPEWGPVRTEMEPIVDEARKAFGANIKLVHDPVYHHKSRLSATKGKDGSDGGAAKTVRELAYEYVDSEDTETGVLDVASLKKVAREITDGIDEHAAMGSGSTAKMEDVSGTDFCLFESLACELSDRGLVFIRAENEDTEGASSNGSGKSTFFKLVAWVLYGECVDGAKGDDVIREGSKRAVGKMTLSKPEERLMVTRTRSKGKPELTVTEESTGNEYAKDKAQKEIEKFIGMDFQAFCNIVLHSDETAKFSDRSTKDRERKEILHRILRTEAIDKECASRAKAGQDAVRKLESDAESLLAAALAKGESAEDELERVIARRDKHKGAQKECADELRDEADELEAAEESSAAGRLAASLELSTEELVERRDELRDKLESLDVWKKRLRKAESDLEDAQEARNELVSKGSKVKAANDVLWEGVAELAEEDVCPTCTAPLDEGEGAAYLADLRNRAEKHDKVLRKADAAELKSQEKVAAVRAKLEKYRTKLAPESSYVKKIKRLESKIDESRERDEEKKDHTAKIEDLRRRARELETAPNPWIESAKEAKERLAKAKSSAKGKQKTLESTRGELALWKFWVKGFGSQGLPSFILDSSMPFITERVNDYLKTLSDGDISLSFSTQRELKSRKGAKDEIDIRTIVEGVEGKPPSKGQRTKIRLASSLALRDLALAREGGGVDVLMLDEVLDGLDATGTSRVFDLLHKLRAKHSSIFAISHGSSMAEIFDHELVVVKRDGVSTLEDRT